jgi:hypothetical protein
MRQALKSEDGFLTNTLQWKEENDSMPSKPYYEMEGMSREDLDFIREDIGGVPDNFIESATYGMPEGTPEPESPEAQEFLKAALDATQQASELGVAPTNDTQGDQGLPPATPPQAPS